MNNADKSKGKIERNTGERKSNGSLNDGSTMSLLALVLEKAKGIGAKYAFIDTKNEPMKNNSGKNLRAL